MSRLLVGLLLFVVAAPLPAQVPADRIAILSTALQAALQDPEARRVLLDQGGRIVASRCRCGLRWRHG